MKLIYFGTGIFAVEILQALHKDVALVVTQPDRPSGRGMKLQSSPVKVRALELGLTVETPEKSRSSDFVERLREENADALVVASYGQILSQAVLDSAKRGGINLHGSILPYYRGAAPIQRCILNGELETGITLMQMDKGMDSGDVIEIVRTPIDPDETYAELEIRLSIIAAKMASEWMPRIVEGNYPRTPQNHEEATFAAKVTKADAELSFVGNVLEQYNRFRAFTPSPGAYLQTKLGHLKLSQVRRADETGQPGTVLALNPDLVVAFDGGALCLIEVQPEGKKRMSGRDFANGARLKIGDRLIDE